MSDTKLTRSRAGTIGFGLAAAAAGAGALALFSRGHWVLGILAGVFALGFAAVSFTAQTADCPLCGSSLGLAGGIVRCGGCGQYVMSEGEYMVPVKPGFVSTEAVFETSVLPLFKAKADPLGWNFQWSGGCCVCGKAATKSEKLKARFSEGKEMLGTMERIGSYTFDLPYCAGDSAGVVFDYDKFKFRSFDYWKAFETSNLGR